MRVRPDDNVTVFFYPHTLELAEEIATECFKAGADVLLNVYTDRYYSAYMRHLSAESLRKPSVFCRGLTELSTAEFWIGGGPFDPAIFRKIPAEKMAANDAAETEAHAPARERKVRSLFIHLGLVTRPRARAYRFNFARWERAVRAASTVSPEKLAADGKRVAAMLEAADRVTVSDGQGTDLRFSVRGRRALVYDGVVDEQDIAAGALDAGIPAGSVSIASIETSAEGSVSSRVAQAWAGRTIRRLRWDFADGRVRSWTGDANALRLKSHWERATGDRDRIGSLTIGLNPRAELGFLQNHIVLGAVTIAVGGNDDLGGANKPGFYHAQTLGEATVEIDGEALVKDGRLSI